MESRNAQGQVIKREYKDRSVIKANKNTDVEIFEDEKHLVHLLLVKKENDPVNKRYIEYPMQQSFNLQDYNTMVKLELFRPYDTVEVLHHPDHKGGKGKGIDTPVITPGAVNDEQAQAAAAELSALKTEFETLYGQPVNGDPSIADLRELIDQKKNQLAYEKQMAIINEVNAMDDKTLKAEFKKASGRAITGDDDEQFIKGAIIKSRMEQ